MCSSVLVSALRTVIFVVKPHFSFGSVALKVSVHKQNVRSQILMESFAGTQEHLETNSKAAYKLSWSPERGNPQCSSNP